MYTKRGDTVPLIVGAIGYYIVDTSAICKDRFLLSDHSLGEHLKASA
jgi:hypothetical protein